MINSLKFGSDPESFSGLAGAWNFTNGTLTFVSRLFHKSLSENSCSWKARVVRGRGDDTFPTQAYEGTLMSESSGWRESFRELWILIWPFMFCKYALKSRHVLVEERKKSSAWKNLIIVISFVTSLWLSIKKIGEKLKKPWKVQMATFPSRNRYLCSRSTHSIGKSRKNRNHKRDEHELMTFS